MGDAAPRRGLAARDLGGEIAPWIPPAGGPARRGEWGRRLGLSGRPPTTTSLGGGDRERPPPCLRTGLLDAEPAVRTVLAGDLADRAPPRA